MGKCIFTGPKKITARVSNTYDHVTAHCESDYNRCGEASKHGGNRFFQCLQERRSKAEAIAAGLLRGARARLLYVLHALCCDLIGRALRNELNLAI